MRRIFYFITGMLAVLLLTSSAKAVTINGKDWRQVTETTSISWAELDVIYDISTGNLDTGTTTIGGVEFTGWTWASSSDVTSMFSSFGMSISEFDSISEVDSSWSPQFMLKFDLTGDSNWDAVSGWVRDETGSNGYVAYVRDSSVGNPDSATTGSDFSKSTTAANLGVWLYQSSEVSVPEPTTVALLGIGLAGLAGAEVRRRRKKSAIDKVRVNN